METTNNDNNNNICVYYLALAKDLHKVLKLSNNCVANIPEVSFSWEFGHALPAKYLLSMIMTLVIIECFNLTLWFCIASITILCNITSTGCIYQTIMCKSLSLFYASMPK